MIERIHKAGAVSQASVYQDLAYCGAVTAAEEQGTAAQTRAILEKYDAGLADRRHLVNAFVILSHDADAAAFFEIWNDWIPQGYEPALTVIRAGLTHGAQVAVALYVALRDDIQRTRLQDGTGMLVRYGGIAYFSGRSLQSGCGSLEAQTKEVMRTYDELLAENGLRKENILNGNIYVQDITMQDEYENVWIGWTYTGHKPSGTMVEGRPVQKEHQLELGLTFADTDAVLPLLRKNPGANCCRFVQYHGVAYFTGNVCKDEYASGLYAHTKGVLAQLQEQLDQNGMRKEDILICNAYLKNIDAQEEFEKAWNEWALPDQAPARTVCGTRLLDDKFELEFTITVACQA